MCFLCSLKSLKLHQIKLMWKFASPSLSCYSLGKIVRIDAFEYVSVCSNLDVDTRGSIPLIERRTNFVLTSKSRRHLDTEGFVLVLPFQLNICKKWTLSKVHNYTDTNKKTGSPNKIG